MLGQGMVLRGLQAYEIVPLYRPGSDPNAPVEEVVVLEGGKLARKRMRVRPLGPRPDDLPGTVRDGLYRMCKAIDIGSPYGPGPGPPLVHGTPWDFYKVAQTPGGTPRPCPIPRGMTPCHPGIDAKRQWVLAAGVPGRTDVWAVCQPVAPKPETGYVPEPWRMAFAPGFGATIDTRALRGKKGKRAKLKAYMVLMAGRRAGMALPLQAAKTVDDFIRHFDENPEAVALFWKRYRRAVRHSHFSYKATKVAKVIGLTLVPVVGPCLAVGVDVGTCGKIVLGIVLIAAIAVTGGGATGIIAQLVISAAAQGAQYAVQQRLQKKLKEEMRKQAAIEAYMDEKMSAELEEIIKRLSSLTKEQALQQYPGAFREMADKARAEGADDREVRAILALGASAEAYIKRTGDFPDQAWVDTEAAAIFRRLQQEAQKDLEVIDQATEIMARTEAAPAVEASAAATPPSAPSVPVLRPTPFLVPQPSPSVLPLAVAAIAFWFLSR